MSVRKGMNLLEENSVDSLKSINHIENIVPRAVSFLNEHSQHSHTMNPSVANNTENMKPEDSVILAQLTLAEDEASLSQIATQATQHKHKDSAQYHLMHPSKRPFSSSPTSSTRKTFG